MNMNEKPLEWLIDCGESTGHKIGRIASLIAAIIMFMLFSMSGNLIALVGLIIFGVIFALMQRKAYVEYEFFHYDGDIRVAAIYNRARRKNKMSFTVSDVEYMVKKVEKQEVTKYFCNLNNDMGNIYTMVLNKEGKRTAIVMEADPEFVKIMERKRKVR